MPTRQKYATGEPPAAIIDGLAAIEGRYKERARDEPNTHTARLYMRQMTEVVELLAPHYVGGKWEERLSVGELLRRLRPCLEDWGPDPQIETWRRYAWDAIGMGGAILVAGAPVVAAMVQLLYAPLENNPHPAGLRGLEKRGTDKKFRGDIEALLPRVGGAEAWAKAVEVLLASEPPRERPALNATEQAIYDMLAELPPSAALKGREILDRLLKINPMLRTEQSTLTSRIIPKLREHYAVESTEAGYRIKPSMRP